MSVRILRRPKAAQDAEELADYIAKDSRVKGFPSHLIFYVEHIDEIEVVRILHGARDLDAELGKT